MPGTRVLTIGHSTHALPVFVDLLQRHGVTAVADVRAAPYSRFNPQFNRESLANGLGPHGIAYVFLGGELGGRSDDPADYDDDGRIDYGRIGRMPSFQEGLERVTRGARRRIALLCAEKEPLECHRGLLVAPALEARGVAVAHVRSDGGLETHAHAMGRLLAVHGLQDEAERGRLFPRSHAERISEAIVLQARRFAHRRQPAADAAVRRRRSNRVQA